MATDQSCFEVRPPKSDSLNISSNIMRGIVKSEAVNNQ